MKGQVLGHGITANLDCPGIPYALVVPERTPANLALVARNLLRWQQRTDEYHQYLARGEITQDVVDRAQFAANVLTTVQVNLAVGVCCLLVAVDPDEDLLGVLVYMLIPDTRGPGTIGLINLLAIDPVNIPGSPVVVQMRGVGTALVAAAATRFLRAGVGSVELHPLDADAERFWKARGFALCRAGGFLCVRGDVPLRTMIAACEQRPESGVEGDCLFCGMHPTVRAAALRR